MLLVALGCAPLGFSSLPAPYNQEERWLIAATGQCAHQSYVQEAGGVAREPEFKGDGFTTAIANVTFDFSPSKSIEFTDAPYHKATALGSSAEQVAKLQSSDWTRKNLALLEPQGDDWAISVFKIEQNGPCADRADCVHYAGWCEPPPRRDARRRLASPAPAWQSESLHCRSRFLGGR